jgi:hypothetical protein
MNNFDKEAFDKRINHLAETMTIRELTDGASDYLTALSLKLANDNSPDKNEEIAKDETKLKIVEKSLLKIFDITAILRNICTNLYFNNIYKDD